MAPQLPVNDIWFAARCRRLWALQRRHTDYTVTYDDYFREKKNA